MIYPTGRAVLVAACLAPLVLAIGVALPQFWLAGLASIIFLLVLIATDGAIGAGTQGPIVEAHGPARIGVGEPFDVHLQVQFDRPGSARAVELAIDDSHLLAARPEHRRMVLEDERGTTELQLSAIRRGRLRIAEAWLRWQGPLGLAWRQRRVPLALDILVTPDLGPTRRESAKLIDREALHGLLAQSQLGEGAEFEALSEFRTGMDKRAIDWKQSARHNALLAKEYRTERNNHIVLAIDCGRVMGDPLGGLARVDRAVSAALLTAYVALKEGDRASLFAFDSHPRVVTQPVAGTRAFALLQNVAGEIDYSTAETNYTLALSTLALRLPRRSLIVIFTDFPDTISAELMMRAIGPLLKRHLILFIAMRDEELEAFAAVEPHAPEDVTRAATAGLLLRQRKLVLAQLRSMGVHVLETRHDQIGAAIVESYFRMKRRSML